MVRKTYTIADVFNLALERVGCRKLKRTDCLDNTQFEVQILLMFWQTVLEKVLEEFKWNFATKTVPLVADLTYTVTGTGFAYAYTYPADCLFARRVLNSVQLRDTADTRTPFRVVGNTTGTAYIILSSVEDAILEYTFVVMDATPPVCSA